jgi:hypothetical protein
VTQPPAKPQQVSAAPGGADHERLIEEKRQRREAEQRRRALQSPGSK